MVLTGRSNSSGFVTSLNERQTNPASSAGGLGGEQQRRGVRVPPSPRVLMAANEERGGASSGVGSPSAIKRARAADCTPVAGALRFEVVAAAAAAVVRAQHATSPWVASAVAAAAAAAATTTTATTATTAVPAVPAVAAPPAPPIPTAATAATTPIAAMQATAPPAATTAVTAEATPAIPVAAATATAPATAENSYSDSGNGSKNHSKTIDPGKSSPAGSSSFSI